MPGDGGATDFAAWWGAVVSTLAIGWEVYLWTRSGARLRVRASPNLKYVSAEDHPFENQTWVLVTVTNVGSARTTLKGLHLAFYRSRWTKLRRQPAQEAIVGNPAFAEPLPRALDPGDTWSGGIHQTKQVEEWMAEGLLFVGAAHSTAIRPEETRVRAVATKPAVVDHRHP